MRASLVIGLGGTGSWANTYLKQRLLADGRWAAFSPAAGTPGGEDGDHPSWPVALRAIDIDVNRPDIGPLRLEEAEDILLTAPVGETVNAIRRGGALAEHLATVGRWLSAEEAEQFPRGDAQTVMTTGAGQIRQFGRIAFFLDMINDGGGLSRLDTALADLASGSRRGEKTVYVVSSVSGGTGAGLLVDVLAYLQRARRGRSSQASFRTIVFVVLPGAYSRVIDADQFGKLQANGYAALRELDRMMRAPGTVTIEWKKGATARLDQPPADAVYLFDGSREHADAGAFEGHDDPVKVFAAAAADAVYTHLLPTSGNTLTSAYTNLALARMKRPSPYSTFGSYVVEYDYDGLTRSLSAGLVRDLFHHLLAEPGGPGPVAAQDLLLGRVANAARGSRPPGALPRLLTDVLPEGLSPADLYPDRDWLLPAQGGTPLPVPPSLRDDLPQLATWRRRSPYSMSEVVGTASARKDAYFGPPVRLAATAEPHADDERFNLALASQVSRAHRDWLATLAPAVVSALHNHGRPGGVGAAVGLLDELDGLLSQWSRVLEQVVSPADAAGWADEKRRQLGEREYSASRQRDYLDAMQDDIEQQVSAACLGASRELLSRMRTAVGRCRESLLAWRGALLTAAQELDERRRKIDQLRWDGDRGHPLRRLVPSPGSEVERRLATGTAGAAGAVVALGSAPASAYAAGYLPGFLHQLRWDVVISMETTEVVLTLPGQKQADNPAYLRLDAVLSRAAEGFTGLRNLNVFDVLEQTGVTVEELLAELVSGGSSLSATGPSESNPAASQPTRWRYVFASWPEDGPGSALGSGVRSGLRDLGITAEDLDGTGAENLPTTHKIIAFSAAHLIPLDAFRGVAALAGPYRANRTSSPPPHVLPEEKEAARLEQRAADLAHEGVLPASLGQMSPREVALCGEFDLLMAFAAAHARSRLRWKSDTGLSRRRVGRWEVSVGMPGQRLEYHDLGGEEDVRDLLLRLMKERDRDSLTARAALEQAGNEVATGPDGIEYLHAFIADHDQPADSAELPGSLRQLLQTVVADWLTQHVRV